MQAGEPDDGLLYFGNPHDSVPRALLTDQRLTPLERNAWQVIRLMMNDDGVTAFPSYAHLGPYLASMPCSAHASDETIARALTLLRLTRWLTLARHRRRDPKTGRIQGNLYVLHDSPLSPYEAIQLDPHYLELVSRALTHTSKAIQRVGFRVLQEATEDPLLAGRVLPSRLQGLMQRLASQGWAETTDAEPATNAMEGDTNIPAPVDTDQSPSSESQEGESPSSESEGGKPPSSDSEGGAKSLKTGLLRNPKKDSTYSTVRTDIYKREVRTVPRARAGVQPQIPERFGRLRPEEQAAALVALQQLDTNLQQPVLDEWAARCDARTVRNPTGYLFALIQRAMRGEFRAWAGQQRTEQADRATPAGVSERDAADTAARREVARQNIEKLRALLMIR